LIDITANIMIKPPTIISCKTIAKTQIFCIESMQLKFSNGEKRSYERLKAGPQGAVMVVPIDENDNLLLIKEWAAGTERYELAFPKGLMELGETVFEAANREMKEEIGYGSHHLSTLKSLTLAPGYLTHQMHLILAQQLFEEQLQGDEPEPLELVKWPLSQLDRLLQQPDFTEARSVAALFLAREHFKNNADGDK